MLTIHISRDTTAPAINYTMPDEYTTFSFQVWNKTWTRGTVDTWSDRPARRAEVVSWLRSARQYDATLKAMYPHLRTIVTGDVRPGRPMPSGD